MLLNDIDFPWYQDSQKTNESILQDIDWLILGPETGPSARPMLTKWARNIYAQCRVDNVPFFDKKNVLGLNIREIPNA